MPVTRGLCLGGGVLALAVAWLGPLPAAAHGSFTAHMTIHMLVTAVAAPLIALGLLPRIAALMPPRGELALPAVASLADLVVVWAWHAPALHHAARTEALAFALEQASFLGVALAVWGSALGCQASRGGALAGAAALFFTMMHMTLLGVLIGLSRVPIIMIGAGGHGAILADQEIGGMVMLGVGGLVYLLGGLALVARELRARPETLEDAPCD